MCVRSHSTWKSGVLADSSQFPFGRQEQVVFCGRPPHQGQRHSQHRVYIGAHPCSFRMNHSRCGLETWNLRKHVANMPYALRELDVRNYSWRDVAWSKLLAACHQMASSGKCRPDWTATQATARVKAPKRLEVCSGPTIPHNTTCKRMLTACTCGHYGHPASVTMTLHVLPLNFHSVGRHVWVRGLASVIFLGLAVEFDESSAGHDPSKN